MKKSELTNFLESALPNETKVYEITEKSIKLAGVELDVSDCLNKYKELIFSRQEVREITNVGELRKYVKQEWFPHLVIGNYTPISVMKFYVERLTNQSFNPQKIYWINWNHPARMSKEEVERAMLQEEKRRMEEERLKKINLKKKINNLCQQLLETKKTLLNLLKIDAEKKLQSAIQKTFLNILLDFQGQLVHLENSSQLIRFSSEKQLNKAKKKLSENLNEEEINQICQLQIEITRLEIERVQEQLEAKIEISIN